MQTTNISKRFERETSHHQRYDYGYQSIHFHLKQQKEQMTPTQIMLSVTVEHKRYRIYIRYKIEPAFWDTKHSCCKCDDLLAPRVRAKAEKINSAIAEIKRKVDIADMHAAELGRVMTIEDLRGVVREKESFRLRRSAPQQSPISILHTLADNFDSAVSNKGEKGASSSRRTYLYCCQRLEAYAHNNRLNFTSFSQFDRQFYLAFAKWLNSRTFSRGNERKQYSTATVQNTIRCISNLHRKAFEVGYTPVPECRSAVVHNALESNSSKVYLTENELAKLMQLGQLSPHEGNVRDMFMLASYTGLRISDVNQLNSAVIADGSIRLFQKKTHGFAAIPILKEISDIIARYTDGGRHFPKLNQNSANRLIKNLCKKAGIDTMTPVRECRGGEILSYNSPKYELVSFHTARRSCITNLYRRGYSPNYLMTMSGHKSLSSFQRYIRTDNEELSADFIKQLRIDNAI